MKKLILISTGVLIVGFAALSSPALAQGKTAKACTEEWRADKANFQAKGVTEKAYVAQCRAGAIPTAAPAPAPTITPPPPVARAPDNSAGAKTAKACTEEWRADKANFQAKGITERAYVAACRAGTAPTATAAPGPVPTVAPPPPIATAPESGTGAKTAKACTEEWRADKANFQAKGVTERAYVAACRAGTEATPTVAPAPAPTTTTAAPPPPAPPPAPTASRPAAEPPFGTTQRGPSTGSPSSAGQYATEAQAKASCLGDTVVWVNLRSKIYHFAGTHNYGNTMNGAYMCERDTAAQGMRAAKNEQHP
jgi:uncharacterized protein (UPF0254 family)